MEHRFAYGILSPDAGLRERVTAAFVSAAPGARLAYELTRHLGDVQPEDVRLLTQADPRLIVLDLGNDPVLGLAALAHLSEENPTRTFLVMGPRLDPDQLLEAMCCGAAEYLPQPIADTELLKAAQRVARRTTPAGTGEEREEGRLYAVMGAKGGTGVTTVATNLAVELRRCTGGSVLLVDLDYDCGTTAFLLGLKPRFSFAEVIRNLHRMDEGLLQSYVERHSIGVDLLAAAPRPDYNDRLTREQLSAALHFLRMQYQHVVVDLARPFAPASAVVIQEATERLVVVTPDLPALHNVKRVLPALERFAHAGDEFRVVLNSIRSGSPLMANEVEQALEREIAWMLAGDEVAYAESVAAAKPLVLHPRSRFGRDMSGLARDVCGAADGEGSAVRGGVLAALRRRPSSNGKAPSTSTRTVKR